MSIAAPLVPTELRLRRAEKRLEVAWPDGVRHSLPAEYLRAESPSAEVQGHGPGQKKLVSGRRHVGIMALEPVGHYAVRIVFDDLHRVSDPKLFEFVDLMLPGLPPHWVLVLAGRDTPPLALARLRVALRHRLRQKGADPIVTAGDLTIDLIKRLVTRAGVAIRLSPKEYELLAQLVEGGGKVCTHRQLLTAVWGPAHVEDVQYLRVIVAQLRQKIELDPTTPSLIVTEPGVGYRWLG